MNFSPNNFYIGIIDLFAILLPGCIVSISFYFLYHTSIDAFLQTNGNSGYISAFILLFSSYFFGHVVSQVSAYLDKYLYDNFKDTVYKDQSLLNQVKEIRTKKYRNTNEDTQLISTFEWSQMKLQKELPEVAQEAERYTADSKFFRSLFLILVLLGIILLFYQHSPQSLGCFLVAAFAMVRYFHKRQKAVKTMYKGVIFIERLNQEQTKIWEQTVNEG
jgi:hypothetical protein